MSIPAYNELCDRIDRLAEKWRPFVHGTVSLKRQVVRADTGELMDSQVLTPDECNRLAHAEMDPLVKKAIDLHFRNWAGGASFHAG